MTEYEREKWNQLETLPPHQRDWAFQQVKKFNEIGVAIPYGMIYDEAKKIQDPKNN